MSITNKEVTMSRIASATPESPIAVFKSSKARMFETCFASTIESQRRIKSGRGLVGVFDNTMGIFTIQRKLEEAL